MNIKFRGFAIAASLLTLSASLGATPVTGVANVAGVVSVSGSSISFEPTFTATFGAEETGSFSGLTAGTIQSLTGGPTVGDTFLPDFMTFTTGLPTSVHFDLTYIAPGVGTMDGCSSAMPGAACTPSGSPFTLFQLTSQTVLASLQLNGQLYTGSTATGASSSSAVFTTQMVVSGSLPNIYAELMSGAAVQGISYSASFAPASPSVPEPSSFLILGLGLSAVGFLALRRKGSQK